MRTLLLLQTHLSRKLPIFRINIRWNSTCVVSNSLNWPYLALNIPTSSTPTEIAIGFYREGLKLHPDLKKNNQKYANISENIELEKSFHNLCGAFLELERRQQIGFNQNKMKKRTRLSSTNIEDIPSSISENFIEKVQNNKKISTLNEDDDKVSKKSPREYDWLDKRLLHGKYSKSHDMRTSVCLDNDEVRLAKKLRDRDMKKHQLDRDVWMDNLKKWDVISLLYNDYIDELSIEISGVARQVREQRSLKPILPFLKHRPSLAVSVVIIPTVLLIPLKSPIMVMGFLKVGGFFHNTLVSIKDKIEDLLLRAGFLGLTLRAVSQFTYHATGAFLKFLLIKVFGIPSDPVLFLWKEYVDAKLFNEQKPMIK